MAINQTTSIPPTLSKGLGPIASRIRYYKKCDVELIREMRCGVIYIVALWSVYAVKAIPAFVKAVGDADLQQALEIVVVDNDGVHDWDQFPQIQKVQGGWGELIAVRDGKIIATSGYGFQPETYKSVVESVIRACGTPA